jgi:hypothetical protein
MSKKRKYAFDCHDLGANEYEAKKEKLDNEMLSAIIAYCSEKKIRLGSCRKFLVQFRISARLAQIYLEKGPGKNRPLEPLLYLKIADFLFPQAAPFLRDSCTLNNHTFTIFAAGWCGFDGPVPDCHKPYFLADYSEETIRRIPCKVFVVYSAWQGLDRIFRETDIVHFGSDPDTGLKFTAREITNIQEEDDDDLPDKSHTVANLIWKYGGIQDRTWPVSLRIFEDWEVDGLI